MNDIAKILEITPSNLANEQLEALKKHVIERLNFVISLVEKEDFSEETLNEFTMRSPAGDDMGDDNHFIKFIYMKREKTGSGTYDYVEPKDIRDVFEKMRKLKEQTEEPSF